MQRRRINAGGRRRRFLLLSAAFFAVIVWAFYSGLTVTRYTLRSDKLEGPVRLVVLTDLHNSSYGRRQRDLLGRIERLEPDLVLLVGDLLDSPKETEGVSDLLFGLKGRYPLYYVTGNHEYWSGDIGGIRELIRGYGVTLLSDRCEALEINGSSLLLAGVEDPAKTRWEDAEYSPKTAMDAAFSDLPEGFRILMAHRPERIEGYLPYRFDLVVSGHAHGGQVRLPPLFPNGLYAPNQGWFPQHTSGAIPFGETTLVVSRGLSFHRLRPRIFNPPEIVVVDLVP